MSAPAARVRGCAVAALLVLVSSAACAQGLPLYSAVTAKKLADAYNNFLDIAATKYALQSEVVQARQRYWQLYPSGPGIDEAGRAYALALQKKDLFFFQERIVTVAIGNMGLNNLGGGEIWPAIDALSGGPVDGGIHPYARREFGYWFGAAYSKEAFGAGTAFSDPAKSERQYLEYLQVRDAGEFLFRNPKSPLRSSSDAEYLAAVIVAGKLDHDFARAQRRSQDIARMAGATRFATGVAKLREYDARDKAIEKEVLEEHRKGGTMGTFKRHFLGLSGALCPDLSTYGRGKVRYTVENVPAAQRGIKFTDACGSHDINYVLAAYNAMNAASGWQNDHRVLVFRDSAGAAYIAGFDDLSHIEGDKAASLQQFLVLPIPLKEMKQRVGSANITAPDPNELAKMSDAELEKYMASRAGRPSELQNATALNEAFLRDYQSFRLARTSYHGRWDPSYFVDRAANAKNAAAVVWEYGD